VKKIISILLALGVLLSLGVMATPAAAQPPCTPITIVDLLGPPDFCAGSASNYLLGDGAADIVLPITLIPGTDSLSVDFPAGTDLSAVVAGGVTVTDVNLALSLSPVSITVTGTHLEFVIPAGFLPDLLDAGDIIQIQVDGVVNPAAGTQTLYVDYNLACCGPVQFDCGTYTVAPAISTIVMAFDFAPTYLGITGDFVPPFKACGQEDYGYDNPPVGWMTEFNLIVDENPAGCAPPCPTANFWFVLEACEAGGVVTLDWDNLNVGQGIGTTSFTLDVTDVGDVQSLGTIDLTVLSYYFSNGIHFSIPGDYEICWYIQCPSQPCGAGPAIVAEKCLPAEVYQWKDAWYIELLPKWNLISLPLYPFDTTIESIFASLARPDQLMSVWYFGQCEDPDPDEGVWHTEVYNATAMTFVGDVDDIVAGKAYWVRTCHPGDPGYDAGAFPLILWVWGNHAPMPPANPMGYFDVCEGWNMVGFKAPWDLTLVPDQPIAELDDSYLWNFNGFGQVAYGLLYDYDEAAQDWTYWLPGTCNMQPGVGYCIPFDGDSEIYPKP